jgi:hypothetical protein
MIMHADDEDDNDNNSLDVIEEDDARNSNVSGDFAEFADFASFDDAIVPSINDASANIDSASQQHQQSSPLQQPQQPHLFDAFSTTQILGDIDFEEAFGTSTAVQHEQDHHHQQQQLEQKESSHIIIANSEDDPFADFGDNDSMTNKKKDLDDDF